MRGAVRTGLLVCALLLVIVCYTYARRKRDSRSKNRRPMAPRWRKDPPKDSQVVVREGSGVTLACGVKARPPPTFTWTRNGRAISPETDGKYRQRRWRLHVRGVALREGGATFTCTAKNPHGSLNFTYSLRVLENQPQMDIDVVELPRNQTAHIGDTVTFLCQSKDFPTPQVYWSRRTDARSILEVVQHASATSSVLVVHNVTRADAGVYTCHMSNHVHSRELHAWLTVITADERLPFEPPCSLHVRREMFTDPETGCQSADPVDLYYCMGSCGRSYSMPSVVLALPGRSVPGTLLTQTCRCCVGVVQTMRHIAIQCPLGRNTSALLPRVSGCKCQECTGHKPSEATD